MNATYASDTSSCRLLRGEVVVVSEVVEKENKERRRKIRVTELNIVRMAALNFGGGGGGGLR
jgi:hypothetical protein